VPPSAALPDAEVIVNGVARQLLHAESADEVRAILLTAVHQLGGATVLADGADASAFPVDLTMGAGQPLLPVADPGSAARTNLERHLPGLVADARQALDGIARTERLSREAATDSLTRLGNQATFARLLARLGPADLVVAIDLDDFKAVNDTYGHLAGDEVLRDFAACLGQHLRASDHAIRLGGDEFALVLVGTGVEDAVALLDRLRVAWRDRSSHPVGFSAGLTSRLTSPEATREVADRALYAAKAAGKGRTSVAAPTDAGAADTG